MTEFVPSSLQSFIDQWPDAILVADSKLSLRYVSPSAVAALGWDCASSCGHALHELLCVQNRSLLHDVNECPFHDEAFRLGTGPVSSVWTCRNGDFLPVDYRLFSMQVDKASNLQWFVVSFHSTRESEYNHSELEKLAEYTNRNPAPLAELDALGNILFANPAFQENLLNYGFNSFGQAKFLPENIQQLCAQTCESQTSHTNIECSSDDAIFRWHFHPIESATTISVLAYGFDITDEKISQEKLANERAAARRDFYAKMVHELRTPLNAIVGFSEILVLKSDGLSDKDLQRLNAIKSAGLQLNDLITDTLDLSKLEAGKLEVDPTEFELSTLLKDLNVQMTGLAEVKGLEYRVSLGKDRRIFADAKKIRQILINLISNSIKYTKSGWVHLSIEPVSDETFGEALEFSVSDSGIGIPPDQIDTLFMSYQQIVDEQNRGIQGTGLGLALVQQMVELIGGRIWVESEYGEGSNFIMRIPARYVPKG